MTPCHSACDCGWPGPDYGPHDPDCRSQVECDEDRMCEKHRAEQEAEYAYLRGTPRYTLLADPREDAEWRAEMRDAGRGHLLRGES